MLTKSEDRQRKRSQSRDERDIGRPPRLRSKVRRSQVENDLEAFLRIVFADLFRWPFSRGQRRSIESTQQVIENGGLHADLEPRGSGKTQRAIRAALWAILTGRRHSVPVITASGKLSKSSIKLLKIIVRHDKMLHRLFPAELHGFKQIESHNRASAGQLCLGEETGISLGSDQIRFPRIPGSLASGSAGSIWSITGGLRGQFETSLDGKVLRPDFVILDDPQTRESAQSAAQTQDRWDTVHGDILGLGGADTTIACVALLTAIEVDDLAERMFSSPKWNATRTSAIIKWPTNMDRWEVYFNEAHRLERIGESNKINELYLLDRAELDAGCEIEWEHQIKVPRVSAIQTLMHEWDRLGAQGFAAEYQNEPLRLSADADAPKFKGLDGKLTRLPRGVVPTWATHLTAAIDVQQRLLYYAVVAWADQFTGAVIDYGAYPSQSRNYFTYAEASPTLQSASGATQLEPALRWGMDRLSLALLSRDWEREGGGTVKVGRCLVDSSKWTDVVFEFCRRSPFSGVLMPSKGFGISGNRAGMNEWALKDSDSPAPGKRFGWVSRFSQGRAIRHVLIDTNHWKTFLAARAAAMPGERGSLSVFGEQPEIHRMFADHLSAETPKRDRDVWAWSEKIGEDNHLLDCLVYSGVGASMLGCSLDGVLTPTRDERRTFSIPAHLRRGA